MAWNILEVIGNTRHSTSFPQYSSAAPPSGEGHHKYEVVIDVDGAVFRNDGTTSTASWTQLSPAMASSDPSGTSAGYMYINTTTGRLMKNIAGTFTDGYVDVVGDSGSGGTAGLVPAPGAGDAAAAKFLRASGAWDTVDYTELDNTPSTFAPTAHASDHTDGTDDIADVTGDSGSGGVKGLVPAPAAGDAAAYKFLKASGAWAAVTLTDIGITKPTVAHDVTVGDLVTALDTAGYLTKTGP